MSPSSSLRDALQLISLALLSSSSFLSLSLLDSKREKKRVGEKWGMGFLLGFMNEERRERMRKRKETERSLSTTIWYMVQYMVHRAQAQNIFLTISLGSLDA